MNRPGMPWYDVGIRMPHRSGDEPGIIKPYEPYRKRMPHRSGDEPNKQEVFYG